MQEKRKRVLVISTGSKAVDAMLGGKSLDSKVKVNNIEFRFAGGVMSQSITEGKYNPAVAPSLITNPCVVYGEYRTGKTQLAHTMSVMTQLPPDLGGAAGKVRWLCISAVYSPQRKLLR